MEYVPTGTLNDVIDLIGPMGEEGCRYFMEQMCDVIGFLHE
jgi:serine/threonine protein kinase